jgi:hypothetical protein
MDKLFIKGLDTIFFISPTLRWIFQCFQCIHLVTLNQEEHISNWTKDRDFILSLLPDDCLRYYQLVT